jgi:hypothetical protein
MSAFPEGCLGAPASSRPLNRNLQPGLSVDVSVDLVTKVILFPVQLNLFRSGYMATI